MAEWTPARYALPTHPKTIRIALLSGVSRHECVGLLVHLWAWAGQVSSDGTLPARRDELATLIGGTVEFWECVQRSGWLVEEAGVLRIPEWDRWCSRTAVGRLTATGRRRAERANGEGKKKRKRAKSDSLKLTPAQVAELQKSFDRFWDRYPKKASKGQAWKTWKKHRPDSALCEQIMEGLERARMSPQWRKNEGEFIPHPSTWLNALGWLDNHGSAAQAAAAPPVAEIDRKAREIRERDAQERANAVPLAPPRKPPEPTLFDSQNDDSVELPF